MTAPPKSNEELVTAWGLAAHHAILEYTHGAEGGAATDNANKARAALLAHMAAQDKEIARLRNVIEEYSPTRCAEKMRRACVEMIGRVRVPTAPAYVIAAIEALDVEEVLGHADE